jgi:uncharacterized protein YdhG (YjbR/CyaY superfamily)
MLKPKNVTSYIAASPKEVRGKLKDLQATIKKTAPTAIERISYGMPFYDYKGRLVYFGIAKAHIGLYIPPPVIAEHKSELEAYATTNATIRLPLDKKLPISLIAKLVRARMRKNEARKRK